MYYLAWGHVDYLATNNLCYLRKGSHWSHVFRVAGRPWLPYFLTRLLWFTRIQWKLALGRVVTLFALVTTRLDFARSPIWTLTIANSVLSSSSFLLADASYQAFLSDERLTTVEMPERLPIPDRLRSRVLDDGGRRSTRFIGGSGKAWGVVELRKALFSRRNRCLEGVEKVAEVRNGKRYF